MSEILENRAKVSDELVSRLLEIFAEFNTNDSWSRVTKQDFTVRRFSTGVDSDLCCVELTSEAQTRLHTEHPAIVVKFKNPLEFADNSHSVRYLDLVTVITTLSELKITPKLIFVNEQCYINQYIPSRNFNHEDDCDPDMVKQLARLVAQVHSVQMPVSNYSVTKWNQVQDDFINRRDRIFGWTGCEASGKKYLKLLENDCKLKDKYYDLITQIDYNEAMTFVNDLIVKLHSPMVFSHCDFNRGNRLVDDVNNHIYLIDFDVASVMYRGIDLGEYFSNFKHQEFMFSDGHFPEDDELVPFLQEYRHESARLKSDEYLSDEMNSLEQLIRECKVFAMYSYVFGTFFGLMWYQEMWKNEVKADYFLNVATNQFRAFEKLKARCINDGTIERILR